MWIGTFHPKVATALTVAWAFGKIFFTLKQQRHARDEGKRCWSDWSIVDRCVAPTPVESKDN